MFQFRPFPPYTYLIQCTVTRYCRVGFPHSEICGYNGYLLLPAAYRSLSRPSSAPDAKAFPLRSFQLDRARRKVRSSPFPATASGSRRKLRPLPCSSLSSRTHLRWASLGVETGETDLSPLQRLVIRDFWFSKELCRQLNGRILITKLLPFTFYGVVHN